MTPHQGNNDMTRSHIVLTKGATVGHYRIIEKIGAGGMGEVYLAEDTELKRKVALKFLPSDLCRDEDCRARFKREAQAAAGLKHPNIVTIYEVSEHQRRPFFAMEYIEGQSLKDIIGCEELGLDRIVDLGLQVCEGLSKAHGAGITHRDIKPSNIAIDADGRPKLLDFGLAAIQGTERLTRTGSTLGTIGYMSPEQIQVKEVDQRSDLFSFGVVLYQMIADRMPFKGDTEAATLNSVLNDTPEPLSRYKSDVPEELQRIVSKLLEKDPQLRYQSTADLISDLKRLKPGVGAISEARKDWWNRFAVVGAAVVILAVAGYLFISQSGSDRTEEPAAERKMLAVLPFENLGASEDEYFADGITDEIISRLSSLHGLCVISRTSTLQYKDTRMTIPEIGAELGADYILEGTIRWDKSGDESRVRINPQLIRVTDDVHMWADRYDAIIDDIFAVQSRIAERVVEELDITLLESERLTLIKPPTENTDAYDYYLRGQDYGVSLGEPRLRNAEAMFQKAIELEPSFAQAWAWLSIVHTQMYGSYYDRTEERLAAAKEAVDRAFELVPGLPDAHGALGWYYYRGDINTDEALKQFMIQRDKQPSDAVVHLCIALIGRRQGKWEDAVSSFQKMVKLNPRFATGCREYGHTLVYLRRYSEADAQYDRTIELRPDEQGVYTSKSWLQVLWKGDTEEARRILHEALERTEQWPGLTVMETYLDIAEGDYEQALSRQAGPLNIDRSWAEDSASYYSLKGDIYRYMNRTQMMYAYYDSARIIMERLVSTTPEDHWQHAYLGWAYAGLGRKHDAIREAELATELMPVSENAVTGADLIEFLAVANTMTGRYDLAIEQLEYLLSIPSEVSAQYLALWPDYAPLRDYPEFRSLLEKHGVELSID